MSRCLRISVACAVIPLTLNVAIFLLWLCWRVEALAFVWLICFLIGLVAMVLGAGSLLIYARMVIRGGQASAVFIAKRVALPLVLLVIYVPAGGEMAWAYLWTSRQPSADIFEAVDRKLVSEREVLDFLDGDANSVRLRDPKGNTALHIAAGAWGHDEFVELLISRGADVNARNERGDTPLCMATDDRNIAKARSLISHGADPNLKGSEGDTPLHRAAEWGNPQVVELLLASGAEVSPKNGKGETPLDLASLHLRWQMEGDHKEFCKPLEDVIRQLKDHGG